MSLRQLITLCTHNAAIPYFVFLLCVAIELKPSRENNDHSVLDFMGFARPNAEGFIIFEGDIDTAWTVMEQIKPLSDEQPPVESRVVMEQPTPFSDEQSQEKRRKVVEQPTVLSDKQAKAKYAKEKYDKYYTTKPRKLKILSWNIWFGEYANRARIKEIARVIQEEAPDVIALQEVTEKLWNQLARSPALRPYARDGKIPSYPREESLYTVMLLSKLPILELPLLLGITQTEEMSFEHTGQGRCYKRMMVKVAQMAVPHGPPKQLQVMIGTSHLESLFGGAQKRCVGWKRDSEMGGRVNIKGTGTRYAGGHVGPHLSITNVVCPSPRACSLHSPNPGRML